MQWLQQMAAQEMQQWSFTRNVWKAVQTGDNIPWQCGVCSNTRAMIPNFESTRNEGN